MPWPGVMVARYQFRRITPKVFHICARLTALIIDAKSTLPERQRSGRPAVVARFRQQFQKCEDHENIILHQRDVTL
jgi:hypothetical protein